MDQLKPGRVLHTKDGRRMGNAIILECVGVASHPDRVSEPVFKIKTDFGNVVLFGSDEIEEYWHTGGLQVFTSVEEWSERRDEKLLIQPPTPEEAGEAFVEYWADEGDGSVQWVEYTFARAAWFAALGLEDPDAQG